MTEKYKGPERREYCAQHCQLNETAKKAVPRWAFIFSMGAMLTLSIAFIGINETRLNEIKLGVKTSMVEQQVRYIEDVRRLYQTVQRNGDLLVELKTNQREIKAKQDLVLKKITIP